MKPNITAKIIEQPGKLGTMKAGQLSRLLQAALSNPEMFAEVERRIDENHETTGQAEKSGICRP